jgi:outer membrane lipoprotein-sorting protein
MLKKLLFVLIVFILGQSCTAFKNTAKPDLEKTSYQLLLQHHAQWQASLRSLSAELRMTLDTPQYSGNFNASVLVDQPDSMLVKVTGPFGMHLGKVFVSKRRFVFYNQVMDQFMKGAKEDFEGRNFLQFPLEIGQMKDVFIARDPFDVLEKTLFEIRDGKYYLEAANGKYNYNIWFEPENLMISRIEYLNAGQVAFVKEYDNWREVNGILFPHLVNFVRPDEKQGFSIIITQLELNKPIDAKSYKIKVSDSATQIDLTL